MPHCLIGLTTNLSWPSNIIKQVATCSGLKWAWPMSFEKWRLSLKLNVYSFVMWAWPNMIKTGPTWGNPPFLSALMWAWPIRIENEPYAETSTSTLALFIPFLAVTFGNAMRRRYLPFRCYRNLRLSHYSNLRLCHCWRNGFWSSPRTLPLLPPSC